MSQLNIVGTGKRVRIYVGESDLWHGRALLLAVLLIRAQIPKPRCPEGSAGRDTPRSEFRDLRTDQ